MTESLHTKVRRGIIWSAVQSWTVRFSALFVFMIIARVLDAHELGLFAAAAVVLTFFGMLAEQGLGEAVVQREHITPEQMNAVFWLNFGTAVLTVGVVWLTAPLIGSLMRIPEIVPILRVSSLALPVSAACFGQLAMRKRNFDYRPIATATLVSTVIGSVVVLVMVFAGAGVWSLVAQTLVAACVLCGWLWARPTWRLTRATDFQGARPLMGYGLSRLTTYLLDFGNTRYIELFLASTLGPAALAVYAVGLKLYQALMQMMSSTVLDVAHSGFSRLANDRDGLVAAYYKAIVLTATVAVPIFCMVAAVAPSLTVVLFGPKWHASAEVMRWMGALGAVQVLQFYNGTVYNAIGRPGIGLQFMVAKVVLTFGALAFVRDGGMSTLLHAYVASQLATAPASFFLVRRLIGMSISELARRIWPMLTGSALLMLAAVIVQSMLQAQGWPVYLVLAGSVAAGLIAYLALLGLAAPQVVRSTLALIVPKNPPAAIPSTSTADAVTK